MAKFYDIDPEACSLEELKEAMKKCELKQEYYNALQLGAKLFINSVYGVFGTNFFNLCNKELAESITLQGQDLIKYSVISLNDYFKNGWKDDEETHARIAEYMKKLFPDFDEEKFKNLAKSNVLSFDTLQVYGDSVLGGSMIHTAEGDISIEDMFNESFDNEDFSDYGEKIRTSSSRRIYCLHKDMTIKDEPIKYIMRHKTNKSIYCVDYDENKVYVTQDHSLIVYDNDCNDTKVIKPEEFKSNYSLIGFDDNNNVAIHKRCSVSKICHINDFVYDICVDTEDEYSHNFFANGILVHNTDSVSKDSIIKTEKHPEGITIEDFYNENSNNRGESTLAGHESVKTSDKVLNYTDKIKLTDVERIIRHKVNKPKYVLKAKSGKTVECTGDHSLVVFRDGKKMVVKPTEIKKGDKIISLK